MMTFPCPKCGAALKAPEEKAGAQTRCRFCGSPVQVPTPPVAVLVTNALPAGTPPAPAAIPLTDLAAIKVPAPPAVPVAAVPVAAPPVGRPPVKHPRFRRWVLAAGILAVLLRWHARGSNGSRAPSWAPPGGSRPPSSSRASRTCRSSWAFSFSACSSPVTSPAPTWRGATRESRWAG